MMNFGPKYEYSQLWFMNATQKLSIIEVSEGQLQAIVVSHLIQQKPAVRLVYCFVAAVPTGFC